jgi:tetratricopeptide (TPR) repeat protein
MNWYSIPGALLLLLLSACATVQDADVAAPPAETSGQAVTPIEQRVETDADVMYHVFAGEVLGNEGEAEKSAAEYLAAALESDDPAIARRATRVAIAAQAWQFAAMAADRWVVLQPESLDARQTAIQALMLNGDYLGAEHQMSGLLGLMQDSRSQAWAQIAAQLAAARNPEKARNMLANLIVEHDAADNADALFAQSQLEARLGDLVAARALAEEAVRRQPGSAELRAWAGRLAVNLEEMEVAMAHYQQALALKPGDLTIAMANAELLKRAGRPDQAIEVLTALPDSPATRFAQVGFALGAERRSVAEEIYQGFHAADYADTLEGAYQAARAAEMLDRKNEAIEWYSQVKKGDRALPAVLRRAVLLAETGRLEESRNLLASTRLHRDQAILTESFLTESQILVNAGLPESAWDLLSEALVTMPGDIDLLYSRALLAVQLDRIGSAERDLRLILQDNPNNPAALNALGYTLADRTDRLDEAEQLIRSAFQLQPEEPSIIDSMGWVAFRLGRYEEALEYLEQAWLRDNNAEIAAHLGEVLWTLGRRDAAKEAWRLGQEQDAGNEVLTETLIRLGVEL